MKKRPLWITLMGLGALVSAWLLSPDLRAAVYDAALPYAPGRGQLWLVARLEALDGAGDLALVHALGVRGAEDDARVARAASAALVRRRALSTLAFGLRSSDPVIGLRSAETVRRCIDDVLEGDAPPGPAVICFCDGDDHHPKRRLDEEQQGLFEPVMPAVIEGLSAPRAAIRAQCLRILARAPRRAAAVAPKLIAALLDPDAEVRSAAQTALSAQGEAIWPRLAPALAGLIDAFESSEDSPAQAEDEAALGAASSSGGVLSFGGPPRMGALLWLLDGLRERRLGEPRVLARLLSTPKADAELRSQAVAGLIVLGEPGFEAMLPHFSGPSGALIAEALIRDLPAPSTPVIAPLLRASDPALRARALALFRERSPASVSREVVACFDAPEPEVRRAAIAVCEAWGQRFAAGKAPLLQATRSRLAAERIAALRATRAYGAAAPERLATLAVALESWQAEVRAAAAAELAEVGAAAAPLIPRLFANLDDLDRAARARAFDALLAIGAPAAPRFLADLESPEAARRARAATFFGAAGQGPEAAGTCLRRLLSDEDAVVRERAAWALGEIGASEPATLEGLRALLKDPSELVRQAAGDALDTLGA